MGNLITIISVLLILNLHSKTAGSETIKKWPLIDKALTNSKGDTPTWEAQKNGILVIFSNPDCPVDQDQKKIIKNIFHLAKSSHLAIHIIAVPSHETQINEEKIKYYNDFFGDVPYIIDTSDYLSKQFRASRTPSVFVFDTSKKTLYFGGLVDPLEDINKMSFAENLIMSIAGGTYRNSKDNPSIGCMIRKESIKKTELR